MSNGWGSSDSIRVGDLVRLQPRRIGEPSEPCVEISAQRWIARREAFDRPRRILDGYEDSARLGVPA